MSEKGEWSQAMGPHEFEACVNIDVNIVVTVVTQKRALSRELSHFLSCRL
jgi:hypothetical protein